MKKRLVLIFYIIILNILIVSCSHSYEEQIKDEPLPQNIEEKVFDSIDITPIDCPSKELLSIPYVNSKSDAKISVLTDEDRRPEAFSVYNEYIFIIDTLRSVILVIKDNSLYYQYNLEYPFTDMIDICVIDEDEFYIFSEPFSRGIYHFRGDNIEKIASELSDYTGPSLVDVFGNKAIIEGGKKYLDIEDKFYSIREAPWGLCRDGEYLVDNNTHSKYKVFSDGKYERLLGLYSDRIYIESYENYYDKNHRKRFINIFDPQKNHIYSLQVDCNKYYSNRDLYIDIEGNLYFMIFHEDNLVIKKIEIQK